ncbi:MAG: lipid-A-disaccharide synthase [Bacteroidales bacterium]|nr:lipid-A-disaccharide synthase [Bacteroidales bacterium]
MRYYLIAGEASGDLHGSNLIKGLRAGDSDAVFRYWGGDLMAAACGGQPPVVHYRDGAVMGVTDVVSKGGALLRNLKRCKEDIASWKPDVVIPVDYPGFNLNVAKFCHESGIRVFYYIAPKTWASRAGRNRKLKAWVDHLYIVFPFEVPYFQQQGIPFTYKGNPLVDAVDGHTYARPGEGNYIAVLPGSRKGEISRMMPVCMEVAGRLGMKVLVAGAPSRTLEDYAAYTDGRDNVEVLFDRTYDILKYADAAIINSGTASLEAALIGTPQVVCWSAGRLTYFVANNVFRVLDHVKYISLGNLCLGRQAFRELIQDDFTPDNVEKELRRLLDEPEYRDNMKKDYAEIRETLGGRGASLAIAGEMIQDIRSAI